MSAARIASATIVTISGLANGESEDEVTYDERQESPLFFGTLSPNGVYRAALPLLSDRDVPTSFTNIEDAMIAHLDGEVDQDDLEDLRVRREFRTTHRPPRGPSVAVGGMRHNERINEVWLDSSVTERVPEKNLRYTAAPRPVHPASLGTAPRAPAARGYVPGARGNPAPGR